MSPLTGNSKGRLYATGNSKGRLCTRLQRTARFVPGYWEQQGEALYQATGNSKGRLYATGNSKERRCIKPLGTARGGFTLLGTTRVGFVPGYWKQQGEELISKKSHLFSEESEPSHSLGQRSLPWCVCMKCRATDSPTGSVCCGKHRCGLHNTVTSSSVSSIASLPLLRWIGLTSLKPLLLILLATTRQYTLWSLRHLERRHYRVVPSCVVSNVRDRHPALDGI